MYNRTQIFRALKRTSRYLNQYTPGIVLHPNKWFKTQDINYTKMLIMCSPGHSVKVPSQQLPLYQPPNFSLFFLLDFLLALFSSVNYFIFLPHCPCLTCLLGFWSFVSVLYVIVLPLFQDKPSSLFPNTARQLLFVKCYFMEHKEGEGKD